MIAVTRYYVPEDFLCGYPPKRLTVSLDVYPSGLVVSNPPKTSWSKHPIYSIVFGSIADVLAAHRATPNDLNQWTSSSENVNVFPCPKCMSVIDGNRGHANTCPLRSSEDRVIQKPNVPNDDHETIFDERPIDYSFSEPKTQETPEHEAIHDHDGDPDFTSFEHIEEIHGDVHGDVSLHDLFDDYA